MKKLLIIIVIPFIFLITSCNKKQVLKLECMKVSCIEDISHSNLSIYLNIYTSLDVEKLKLDNNKYIEKSILTLKKTTSHTFDEKVENAFIYQFLITFKKEIFTLNNIKLLVNNTQQLIDIGIYKTVNINHDNQDIKTTTNIINNKIHIYIHNNLDRTIYLTKIEEYPQTNINLKIDKINLSDTYLYQGTTKNFNLITITIPKDTKTVSGILKLEFTTNLKQYIVYTSYYLNDTLEVLKVY